MKTTPRLRYFLLACGSLFAITSLHAAPLYWDGTDTTADADGGDGTWDNVTLNWDDATTGGADTAWVSGETAVFGATAGTVTLVDNVTVGGITFDTNGYTLDPDVGGTFQVTFGTAGDIAVNTGTSTINAAIGGSSKITKTGSGVLNLLGANTFTGGFDINGGRVSVTDSAHEGSYFGAASNTVTFTGDSELFNSNGTVTLGQNIAINDTVTGTISGAFGERIQVDGIFEGSGTLIVQGYSAGFDLELRNTSNIFTGAIEVRSGDGATLGVRSLGDSSNTIGLQSNSNNGGKFEYMSGATSSLVLDNRQFQLIGNGNSGTNFGRQASIDNNAATANTLTINTSLYVVGTGNKNFMLGGSNAGDNAFNGAIEDAIGVSTLDLYKQGGGKWILGGVNTYEGDTIVDAGTLELATNAELLFVIGALGENNAILGDASNATLDLNGILAFNLTGASTTQGDFWNIVDVDNLNETYDDSTFSVRSIDGGSFSENGDVWTISENGVTYSFAQATGTLTVIPEPSGALLGGLGCLLLLRRRRG